ncbi:MAG: tetratricopeptide repeat protein [Gemmatimonadota bacterium]|nr:MAG: tetratricopeptide repeat protein [Gemmatimonadota bacterium]
MWQKSSALNCILIVCVLILVSICFHCASTKNMEQSETVQETKTETERARLDSTQIVSRKKHYSQLYEYWKNGMYAEALEPGHKVIEIDSTYTNAYFYLADCYVKLEEFDKAQTVYEAGLRIDPENKYFHRGLAWVLLTKGLEEQAISEYEIVVEQFPEESSYHLILAKLYVNHENDEGAAREFERAVAVDLKTRERWIEERDTMLSEKGPDDQQVQEYTTKIEETERQIRASLSTLEILYRRNDMGAKLVDVYFHYLKMDSLDTQAMLNLGKQYYELGENEKGEEILRKLIEMDPDNIDAHKFLGGCCVNLKKNAEAIAAYKRVVALDPENKRGWTDLASTYNEIGQYDEAERSVKRALRLDPDYGYAHVVYGEIYEARGEPFIEEEKSIPIEGKLIFLQAWREYDKARKDPEWRNHATIKIEYLNNFIPTAQDTFFHNLGRN